MTSGDQPTALLDANILVSIRLTDLFMQLAVDDLYKARWTAAIHQEWMRALRERRPDIPDARIVRRRVQMDDRASRALVTGYEYLVDYLDLPDKKDRHVLAAAIVGGCDVIVTYNLRDFPREALSPFELEAQHPDQFLKDTLELRAVDFCTAVRKIRSRHIRRKHTVAEYLAALEAIELRATAAALRQYAHLLE